MVWIYSWVHVNVIKGIENTSKQRMKQTNRKYQQLFLTMISVNVYLYYSLILCISWRSPYCSFNGGKALSNVLYYLIVYFVMQPKQTFTISCFKKGWCSLWAAGRMEECGGPQVWHSCTSNLARVSQFKMSTITKQCTTSKPSYCHLRIVTYPGGLLAYPERCEYIMLRNIALNIPCT